MNVKYRDALCLGLLLLSGSVFGQDAKAPADGSKLDFEELTVDIKPFERPVNAQVEHLKFESKGVCWYRADGYPAEGNQPARNGGVFSHKLPPSRINRLNDLLKTTKWLEAEGGDGPARQLHAGTITITLKRGGMVKTIDCVGDRPEPYKALLHELNGIAVQERRIYQHDYISGKVGHEAWQEVGLELAAWRGDPYSKSRYDIDYERYLTIARRYLHDFHGKQDDDLITSIRLVAFLKSKSELEYLHRLSDDRSMKLRIELAMALGAIHEHESLAVLVRMMPASGSQREVGYELIKWGGDATADIVKLIGQSTDPAVTNAERTAGEFMIRAYIENFSRVKPIDPAVIAAVQKALAAKDPMNGLIRTTYHTEFLKLVAQ